MTRHLLGCLLLLAAAACGGSAEPAEPGPQRYEVVATVLENPEHGPEICAGIVLQSDPPQCGGIPVPGWDWDAVDGVESRLGVTWGGDYRLVGTYDGAAFTLTEPPGPRPPFAPPEPTRDACTDPRADEPLATFSRVDKAAMAAAMGAASAAPDFAGLWVTGMDRPWEPGVRFDDVVLNLAFTGDLARHRAQAREVWGGLLCLERHEHALSRLRAVQDELMDVAEELGMTPTSAGADEVEGVVDLTVVHVTPEQRAALAERFGQGVVVVSPALRPLD